ncbi:hypothetical protein BT96DRAFT_986560 [Gymnopus androsaceus JB14]|uniref:Uncharacterized protein n=1 Tax=Gymnopus androsaceus JB14 TaxID=1447944 RepID=A0A6A4IE49_9AGAR|nr:hypothetical protein BT96DRAFT_986560 [Gymnopus androsaceus JB14]
MAAVYGSPVPTVSHTSSTSMQPMLPGGSSNTAPSVDPMAPVVINTVPSVVHAATNTAPTSASAGTPRTTIPSYAPPLNPYAPNTLTAVLGAQSSVLPSNTVAGVRTGFPVANNPTAQSAVLPSTTGAGTGTGFPTVAPTAQLSALPNTARAGVGSSIHRPGKHIRGRSMSPERIGSRIGSHLGNSQYPQAAAPSYPAALGAGAGGLAQFAGQPQMPMQFGGYGGSAGISKTCEMP